MYRVPCRTKRSGCTKSNDCPIGMTTTPRRATRFRHISVPKSPGLSVYLVGAFAATDALLIAGRSNQERCEDLVVAPATQCDGSHHPETIKSQLTAALPHFVTDAETLAVFIRRRPGVGDPRTIARAGGRQCNPCRRQGCHTPRLPQGHAKARLSKRARRHLRTSVRARSIQIRLTEISLR